MRAVALKTTQLETGEIFEYGRALIDALRVNDGGMDIAEMEKAVTCIGVVRRAINTKVEGKAPPVACLEEEYFNYLIERLDAQRWRVADPAILTFIKNVKATEQVEASGSSQG